MYLGEIDVKLKVISLKLILRYLFNIILIFFNTMKLCFRVVRICIIACIDVNYIQRNHAGIRYYRNAELSIQTGTYIRHYSCISRPLIEFSLNFK